VNSPTVAFLPDDLYSLDILVVPMWGLYANLIAQLISQISSHFIIHYHRNIVHRATGSFKQNHHLVRASLANLALNDASDTSSNDSRVDCPYGERKDLLHCHAYARPHRGESGKLIIRSYVNTLAVFVAVVFSVLTVIGCVLPSAGLNFLGVLGVAVEAGQAWEEASTKLSVFDLVKLLMDQAAFVGGAKDYVGLGTLSVLLIITVLIIPLAQTAVLLYQWFVPMTGRKRRHVAITVETLQAWQYMEVYVISVIVATWQLGPISTFMINGYCESFQETFDLLSYFGILEAEDAQCFRVDASIESGAYILVAAAILLALLNTFVMNAAKQYFRDRDELISRAELKERAVHMMDGVQRPEEPTDKEIRVEGDEADGEAVDNWEGRQEAEGYIKPVPVLFTDKFRHVLRRATPIEELNGQVPLQVLPVKGLVTERRMSEASSDDDMPTTGLSSKSLSLSLNEDIAHFEPTVTVLPIGSGRNRLESDESVLDA
jgi:Paraquat-inducible protein A